MSCDNRTLSVDTRQLQRRYDDLVKEKLRLDNDYIRLGEARDQLRVERNDLQRRLSDIGTRFFFFFFSNFFPLTENIYTWTKT